MAVRCTCAGELCGWSVCACTGGVVGCGVHMPCLTGARLCASCRGCPAVRHSATPHLVAATTDLRGATGVTGGDGGGWIGGRRGGKVVVGGERGEVKMGSKLDMMRGHRHPPRA